MKLTIIGSGYVGLVTGACFAEMGNKVFCVDNDAAKIETLNKGAVPIYEPGLVEMIGRNREAGRLSFVRNLSEALAGSAACFIAVGTPAGEDGAPDLAAVYSAAEEIGRLVSHDIMVVIKSTVPPGTARQVEEIIGRELKKREAGHRYQVVSNPEFLKEGSAINDCLSPDRVVIGASDAESAEMMKELYAPFFRTSDRFIVMDQASAEMTKYAANAMLATRISFMNEMAGICEKVGADVDKVRLGLGSDSRIGLSFLFAGCGYGGSCFPKDVQALIRTAETNGCEAEILRSVEKVNVRQKKILAKKIEARFGKDLTGRVFTVWGLAFKPGTDDMREAPSLTVIEELLSCGATIRACDPKALKSAEAILRHKRLTFSPHQYAALDGVDALLLLTEWKQYRSPDFDEMKTRMKTPIIFDGRNQYKAAALRKLGFEYYRIGGALPLQPEL